jgi:hypothetical protein
VNFKRPFMRVFGFMFVSVSFGGAFVKIARNFLRAFSN